jgi:scyllo-inositol 2-dehydrogenase (NADP+)
MWHRGFSITDMTDIGVGIIGFGLAGRVFHAPFVSAVPGLRLEAFVERSTNEAAGVYPTTRTCRSVEELLADPSVALVVVGTPNATHYSLAKQALEAGKHVVIDKPFAETSAQAEELISIANRNGLVLAPFHNRRWDGDFRTLRSVMASGKLGRVVTFESHFDRFKPAPREGGWKETASQANGMLMDLGPHLVDQALALFGWPDTVTASVRSDRDKTAIEDAFDIALGYEGLIAMCRATMLACEPGPRFLVHGTQGSFRKWGLDPQEPAIVAGARVPRQGEGEWLHEEPSAWGELAIAGPGGAIVRSRIETEPGDYRIFYANVRDAIRGSAALEVTPEEGRDTIRILEAARLSSAEGRSIVSSSI